ncbi:hypothetical protein O3G_MSEX009360 [Manduca sexta]|uniref:Uncharacterized protein n=1 Tax=Manduca sexta TaxID=7130 RepID=A0A921ZD26_MANSE|nr:hypothetical protein O3G_MSEX009360 [Manduca sexta]
MNLSPNGYVEAQLKHPLFAKCVPSHDVIGGELIAISGSNSRLRLDTEQKNLNTTLFDPGFESRTSARYGTAHAEQLRHRDSSQLIKTLNSKLWMALYLFICSIRQTTGSSRHSDTIKIVTQVFNITRSMKH